MPVLILKMRLHVSAQYLSIMRGYLKFMSAVLSKTVFRFLKWIEIFPQASVSIPTVGFAKPPVQQLRRSGSPGVLTRVLRKYKVVQI